MTIIFIANNTLFNKDFIMINLQHSDYIATAAEQIRNNMAELGKTSGFSNDFFIANVSNDDIQRDILQSFEKLYNDENEESKADFENMLYNKFVEYGTSNGSKITEGVSANLHKLSSCCGQIYSSYTSIPCDAQIKALIQIEKNFVGAYVWIGLILLLFISTILFLINLENLCELTKLLIIIFTASCLSLCFIILIGKILNIKENLQIPNLIFKDFTQKCCCSIEHEFLIMLINFSIPLILLAVFYIFLIKNTRCKTNKIKFTKK